MNRALKILQSVVSGLLLIALVACSENPDPSGTPEPSDASATSTIPSPSPPPSTPPTRPDDPGGNGLAFDKLPEVSGREAAALEAYVHFEELRWQAMTTGQGAGWL